MSGGRKARREASQFEHVSSALGRALVFVMVVVLVTSSFVGVVTPVAAQALDPIEVSQCGTLDQTGREYHLANDILDVPDYSTCVVIVADGITFDGRGYTIGSVQTGYSSTAISVGGNNAVVKNTVIDQFDVGVYYSGLYTGGQIRDMTISTTRIAAIYLVRGYTSSGYVAPSDVTVTGNVIKNGGEGIRAAGAKINP